MLPWHYPRRGRRRPSTSGARHRRRVPAYREFSTREKSAVAVSAPHAPRGGWRSAAPSRGQKRMRVVDRLATEPARAASVRWAVLFWRIGRPGEQKWAPGRGHFRFSRWCFAAAEKEKKRKKINWWIGHLDRMLHDGWNLLACIGCPCPCPRALQPVGGYWQLFTCACAVQARDGALELLIQKKTQNCDTLSCAWFFFLISSIFLIVFLHAPPFETTRHIWQDITLLVHNNPT